MTIAAGKVSKLREVAKLYQPVVITVVTSLLNVRLLRIAGQLKNNANKGIR